MELTDEVARRAVAALHRPWWKPADPYLLTLLMQRNSAQNIRLVRFGIVAAALANGLFCFLDYLLLPDVATALIMVRLGVGALFVALVEIAARNTRSLTLIHSLAAIGIVTAAIGWLIPALQSREQVTLSQFMVFGTIFVLGANLFFNFRFWLSALSSATVTIAFVYGLMFSLDINETARGVLSLYFVSILVLSLYLSWQLDRKSVV